MMAGFGWGEKRMPCFCKASSEAYWIMSLQLLGSNVTSLKCYLLISSRACGLSDLINMDLQAKLLNCISLPAMCKQPFSLDE